ncbi:AAA family ATPase [Methylomonas albis]|uniref:AAA family ATPase n=1 Tax=Methylomonas albis TaxID=1854563 RepID=A0ABR9D744_9GAMM|nr:AAA family ATPase [Methylomonas albis]MBD9358893.1 AAA family ATPase [Methylomonas albis]
MGKIHLILGPQGSGKSTYARRLAQAEHATRFSIDEWMQQMFVPDIPKAIAWIYSASKPVAFIRMLFEFGLPLVYGLSVAGMLGHHVLRP